MAKKNLLHGFVFKKLDEISNGLMIPTGNAKTEPVPKVELPLDPVYTPPVKQVAKPITKRVAPLQKLEIDNKAFTPMINVVPTINPTNVPTNDPVVVPTKEQKFKRLSRKAKQRVTHEDLNWDELSALPTKQDKIVYLSMRGWSLKTEMRNNTLFHYATKYIRNSIGDLDKKRLYLGSVNRELSEGITIKSEYLSRHNVNTK